MFSKLEMVADYSIGAVRVLVDDVAVFEAQLNDKGIKEAAALHQRYEDVREGRQLPEDPSMCLLYGCVYSDVAEGTPCRQCGEPKRPLLTLYGRSPLQSARNI